MSRDERFGTAWVLFALALALHVIDEAANDFLSVYTPNAQLIRERFGIPVPIFTFESFVASLGAAVLLLLCLSPFAYRGAGWLRVIARPLAVIVGIFNACLHVGSSIWFHRFMPGVYSSPVMLAAGLWLLAAVRTGDNAKVAAA